MASGYIQSNLESAARRFANPARRTSRDTIKALNAFFSVNTTARTVSYDVQSSIQAYLDKHEDADASDSQKIHDELKSIYNKHVVGDRDARLGAFLDALKRLQPVITGYARKVEWWKTVLGPILDGIGHRRDEIANATDILLAFMDYDDDDAEKKAEQAKESGGLLKLLVAAYMKRARTKDVDTEVLTEDDEYISNQLEDVLVAFGRRKPKEIMMALDGLIVDVKTRFQAMSLLCAFVRHQPPHLYTVSETPLIEHLLKCLMIDTSSTIIQIALTTLIMFLPHIPSSIVTHLPRLFLIYTRLLCWEHVRRPPREDGDDTPPGNPRQSSTDNETDSSWVKLETLLITLGPIAPNLNFYFTFLYGMYPINFISYIRKPRKYLKGIDFPRAEEFDFDQVLIKKRTDEFRKLHIVHPNFFMTTAEEELEDDRWIKSDPADVVGECMGLCMGIDPETAQAMREAAPLPGHHKGSETPPEFIKTEDIPTALLNDTDDLPLLAGRPPSLPDGSSGSAAAMQSAQSGSTSGQSVSRKASQKSTRTPVSISSAFNSPALRSVDEHADTSAQPAPVSLEQIKQAVKPRNGSVISLQSSSEHSARLDDTTRPLTSMAGRSTGQPETIYQDANKAFLQREVMLLRNDLNFERYLKQQHLSHIGQLQRRQIKEATLEADTQNLIQTNKTLKAKLAKANETYASLKKETATGRQNSKRFETELSSKMRSLREAQRAWELREGELVSDLNGTKSDCAHLRRLIVESEARELLSQQKVASMEIQLEQVDELRAKVAQLEQRVKVYQSKELVLERAQSECEVLRTQLATANFRLQNKDDMDESTTNAFKQHVLKLEEQLQEAREPANGQPKFSQQMQVVLDNAIAFGNARYERLRREYASLKHRFVDLEIRNQELEAGDVPVGISASTRRTERGDEDVSMQAAATPPHRTLRPSDEQDSLGSSATATPTPTIQRQVSRAANSLRSHVASTRTTPSGNPNSTAGNEHDGNDLPVASSEGASSAKAQESPSLQARVFGWGVTTNVASASASTGKDPKANLKSGGFRGLRGII